MVVFIEQFLSSDLVRKIPNGPADVGDDALVLADGKDGDFPNPLMVGEVKATVLSSLSVIKQGG